MYAARQDGRTVILGINSAISLTSNDQILQSKALLPKGLGEQNLTLYNICQFDVNLFTDVRHFLPLFTDAAQYDPILMQQLKNWK